MRDSIVFVRIRVDERPDRVKTNAVQEKRLKTDEYGQSLSQTGEYGQSLSQTGEYGQSLSQTLYLLRVFRKQATRIFRDPDYFSA